MALHVFFATRIFFYAADATNWLSFFLFSLATVSMETILFVSFSAAKCFVVGADGSNWSTASKMLFVGAYSMNSSESRSSTTDNNTRERTGNTKTNKKVNTANQAHLPFKSQVLNGAGFHIKHKRRCFITFPNTENRNYSINLSFVSQEN